MKNSEIQGTVISVKKQWWLKINTKIIRKNPLDGAIFPHIIKVKYTVYGQEYVKRKWVKARISAPKVGDTVTVVCDESNPENSNILL
jgi:hypothetical protein